MSIALSLLISRDQTRFVELLLQVYPNVMDSAKNKEATMTRNEMAQLPSVKEQVRADHRSGCQPVSLL